MMKTHTPKTPSFEESTIDDCESMLVCLDTRRFVVVRLDQPRDFWPIDGGWQGLRRLKVGDEVIYKGTRTTVRALDVYQ